jgi:glutathione synthase/RimK-type ligase-like ATP-grasp enzyme
MRLLVASKTVTGNRDTNQKGVKRCMRFIEEWTVMVTVIFDTLSRGHRYAAEHTHTVLEWLELHGRRVINGSRALSLEISKIRQYRALEQVGIKTPRTVVVTANPEVGN